MFSFPSLTHLFSWEDKKKEKTHTIFSISKTRKPASDENRANYFYTQGTTSQLKLSSSKRRVAEDGSMVASRSHISAQPSKLNNYSRTSNFGTLKSNENYETFPTKVDKSTKSASSSGSGDRTAATSSLCCDKCDGKHLTDNCPYFKKTRETHPGIIFLKKS